LCRLFPRAANGHVVCRPAGGPCDLPESCSASSPECPPDRLVEARTTCRASTAPCDAAERCDGAHAACPVDGLAPSGTTCRPSSVPCDAVETCDGVSPGCPVDRPMISGDACVSPATGPGVCVDADGPLVCSPLAACRIGGAWVREQARDATGCRVCLPARRAGAWSFLPDGTTCPGGTCDGGGTCETACDESPCPALAPRLDALTPDVVHARLETQVWVSGARLAGARATLVRPGVRVDLTRPLSRDGLLRVTVPEGLDAGDWDLEVAGTEGVSTLTGGLRVTAGPLTVTVLDVGQGDASLVHAPGGRTVLIDGGLFGMGRSRVDPRLSAPPDYVVSTHFDADHLAGLYEVLAGPDQLPNTADDVDPVIALLDHGDNRSCGSQLCERYLALRARLEAEGKARAIVPGEELDLGGGATVTCAFTNGVTGDGRRLFTAAENENSVGLVFGFAGFRYYSGGDVTGGAIEGCGAALSGGFEDVEGAAARFIGQVDAMKVSHHGSCTATPPAFAASVLPQVALNPAGLDNPFCHPADRVLANLAHVGADLLLTTPGMVTPGANGCSPTVRPTDRTAPVFGTLSLVVPGDGTFSASAFDGATTWSRSYTARAFEPLRESMPTTWPLPDGVTFVGRRGLQPVAGPIALNLPRVPPTDRAWLLPWALVDDALLVDVTRSVPVEGTVPATVTRLGKRLSVAPATALAAREAYALVLPGTTLGTSEPVVLPFLTGVDTSPGPAATLVSSVADAMNLAEVTVRFDRPVTGVTASSFFLEERLSGSDVVFGTVRAAQDGRTYTLEVPGSSRIGAGGVSCTGLCPSLPYAVRLTSDIRDAGGRPAEAALAPTFTSGSCVDTTAPTLTAATVRTFGGAATVSFQSDEPVAGVLRVVPSGGSFEACGSGAPDCVEVAVTGSCRTSACAPSAASCTQWAVVTGLTPGRSYDWSLAARDVTLRAAAPQTGGFTTVDAAVPVVTEVAADVPGTEELGEYVEVMNAGSQPLDLCALRLGRTSSELRVLCTVPATFVLEPGSRALLVGGSFCESGGTCTPTWTLPAGTGVLRTSSAKLFSAGIANATLPTVILQTTGAVSVSTVPGGGTCPEGQSRTRSSPYAPDVSGAFGCAASSPGTGP
jgi:hypothetical protein